MREELGGLQRWPTDGIKKLQGSNATSLHPTGKKDVITNSESRSLLMSTQSRAFPIDGIFFGIEQHTAYD
jgi:hypothetical protein